MNSSIPSLSLDGWIDNKHMQMAKLWEYFMASEYSQTNLFNGEIASLKYLLATSNPGNNLKLKIEEALIKMYNNYFDNTVCEVNIDSTSELDKYKVYIQITCIDNNNRYYLEREIKYSNGKIEDFEKSLDELYESYVPTN